MVNEIFLATKNEGKLGEFRTILKDMVHVRSVYEIVDRHIVVEEDGGVPQIERLLAQLTPDQFLALDLDHALLWLTKIVYSP